MTYFILYFLLFEIGAKLVICFKKLNVGSRKYKICLKRTIFLLLILFQSSCTSKSIMIPGFNSLNNKFDNSIDVNSDGKSDLIFWNFSNLLGQEDEFPNGCFFETISPENSNHQLSTLGEVGDIPVYGDFNGNGSTDYGVYKFNQGGNIWELIDGLTMDAFGNRFGDAGDLPVPGDYDGDNKCDYVVYRPKNSGFYGYLSDRNKLLEVHFGITGDIPVPKDYDGDGYSDLATYREISGNWLIKSSKNGLTMTFTLGGQNYLPIPADYDGDGKNDLAVWNYKNHDCKILFSFFNQALSGQAGSVIKENLKEIKSFPVSLDIDNDKKNELLFWESDRKLMHIFKIKKDDAKYKTIKLEDASKNSIPVNFYLIKIFSGKDFSARTLDGLKKKIKKLINEKEKKIAGDFDGDFLIDLGEFNVAGMIFSVKLSSVNAEKKSSFDFTGNVLAGDFDGDNRYDIGAVDFGRKIFSFNSLTAGYSGSLLLNDMANGLPFAADIDCDSKFDLLFYNPETQICGFQQSGDNYNYNELFVGEK